MAQRDRNRFFAAGLAAIAFLHADGLMAQGRDEYGYKDRIFIENFYVPDDIDQEHASPIWRLALPFIVNFDWPQRVFSRRFIEATGGICDTALLLKFTSKSGPVSIFVSSDQSYIDAMPKAPDVQLMTPNFSDLCMLQSVLFRKAYDDGLSTDRQLSALAEATRRRFATQWVSPSDAERPGLETGALRLSDIYRRIDRLRRIGVTLPPEALEGVELVKIYDAIVRLASDGLSTSINRKLEAVEAQAAEAGREAEDDRRQRDQEARQPHPEGEASSGTMNGARSDPLAEMHERIQGCWQPPPNYPRTLGRVTVSVDFNPDGSVKEAQAQISKPLSAEESAVVASMLRAIRRCSPYLSLTRLPYEQWKAVEFGFVLPDTPRLAEKAEIAGPPGPDMLGLTRCSQGQRCIIVEKSVFCRTQQQFGTLLSQPPGPARRTILGMLKDTGACVILDMGVAVTGRGPVTTIAARGEPSAQLLPVTFNNQDGFIFADALSDAHRPVRR